MKRFFQWIKPEFHIYYHSKEDKIKIEVLTRSEENLKTERKGLIQTIKNLNRRISNQNTEIKSVKDDCNTTKERLYDAIYIMLGYIDDPVIKRQVDSKLKNDD